MDRTVAGAALVQRLVAAQFPQWAHLPVTPVAHDGWDNTTFRLGDDLSVRMPSAERYVAQLDKEHRWLPRLAPHLPLPIPEPVALGAPGPGFPWPWSVRRWLPGEHAIVARVRDLTEFATDLAGFLAALRAVDPSGGPAPGAHNFSRGGPPATYDADTRAALATIGDEVDGRAALAVWEGALASRFGGPPAWFHGDVAAANLLVTGGHLAAVVDFGCCGVGDPACDTAIAWTFFDGSSRAAFRDRLGVDAGTWARGRGWALWKALLVLRDTVTGRAAAGATERRMGWRWDARRVVAEVLGADL